MSIGSRPDREPISEGISGTGSRGAACLVEVLGVTIANVAFIACGASLLAAGAIALPFLLKADHPAADAQWVTVTVTA